MAKLFDEENVHDFWGLSPAMDVIDVLEQLPAVASQHGIHELLANSEASNILQIGAFDCRHTALMMSRLHRHKQSPSAVLHLWVFEEAPEILARHMLLLSVLLDSSLPVRQRTELFIELHSNALLQQTSAEYLERMGKSLEAMTLQYSSKEDLSATGHALTSLFDLSLLRFQQRDDIAETFRKYSQKTSYDMQKAWEVRSRKFYGPRYDHKRNAIDWDYHMRLTPQSKAGLDPVTGSIIHFYHFRRWRESGVAYELRDCKYNQPNRSLLSTAYGKRKEYTDRLGNDQGRSVSAWGFWGDILNSPYHSFGTACDEKSLFKMSNKQHTHTAVDVAEYNVKAMIEELRTREPYKLPKEGFVRSKLNAGPTSIEDLEGVAAQADAAAASASYDTEAQVATCDTDAQVAAESTSPAGAAGFASLDSGSASQSGCSSQEASGTATTSQQEPIAQQLDAAALESCMRVKIHLLTGDLKKLLLSRSKYAGMFCAVLLGHRHAHLVDKEHGLIRLAPPGGVLAVETVKNMLQLSSKQVDTFNEAISGKACAAGWQNLDLSHIKELDAHQLFTAPA